MTDEKNELAVIPEKGLTIQEFKNQHQELAKFIKAQLRESKDISRGGDYGIVPTAKKKSLFKPGAEKLLKFFGLVASYELLKEIEDFDNGFVFYKYRCIIKHGATGMFVADAIRSSNNKEGWIRSKTVYEAANSADAKAQKRALVAATVQATMASEIFDADISDNDDEAPNKPVTKDEDPRRIKVMGAYFAAARDRGFTPEQAKNAAHRKLGVESLKDVSNNDIEKLTEELIEAFDPVADGEKPKKKSSENNKSEDIKTDDPIDGEFVDHTPKEPVKYYCPGPKHPIDQRPETSVQNNWCSEECENDVYGKKKEKDPEPWKRWQKDHAEKQTV